MIQYCDGLSYNASGLVLQVSDVDHIDRLMSCMHMAVPFFLVWTHIKDYFGSFSQLHDTYSSYMFLTLNLYFSRGVHRTASSLII